MDGWRKVKAVKAGAETWAALRGRGVGDSGGADAGAGAGVVTATSRCNSGDAGVYIWRGISGFETHGHHLLYRARPALSIYT